MCISAASFIVVLSLVGKSYKDTKEFPSGYDLELGWSYYVAVAGTIFTCLSVFTTGFEAYLLKNRVAGYENI